LKFDIEVLFRVLDSDDSGGVDRCELMAGLSLLLAPLADDKTRLELLFHAFDTDMDNSLSLNELDRLLKSYVAPCTEHHNLVEYAEEIFALIDLDGDGKLTLDEFLSGVTNDMQLSHALLNVDQYGRKACEIAAAAAAAIEAAAAVSAASATSSGSSSARRGRSSSRGRRGEGGAGSNTSPSPRTRTSSPRGSELRRRGSYTMPGAY